MVGDMEMWRDCAICMLGFGNLGFWFGLWDTFVSYEFPVLEWRIWRFLYF